MVRLEWKDAMPAIRVMSEKLLEGMEELPAYAFLPNPGSLVGVPMGVNHKESWEHFLMETLQKPGAPDWFGFLLPSQSIQEKPTDKRMELLLMGCLHRDGRQQGAAFPYVSRRGKILIKGAPKPDAYDFRPLFGNPWLRAPEPGQRTTGEPAQQVPGELGRVWAECLRKAQQARILPGALLLAGSPTRANMLTRRRRSFWPQAIDHALKEDGGKEFLLAFASDAYVAADGGPAFACDEPGEKFFAWVWRGQGQPAVYGVMPYTWSNLIDSDYIGRRPTPEMQAYLDRLVPNPWAAPGKASKARSG